MDRACKLPEAAATGSPAAREGEWQPCVVELAVAEVLDTAQRTEVDNILGRALEEQGMAAAEDTRSERSVRSHLELEVGHLSLMDLPDSGADRKGTRASDRPVEEDIVPGG